MATTARCVIGIALAVLTCRPTPATAQTCVGDCNGNGTATIDELVRGVNILLERAALELCPSLDASGDGTVAVNELVRAVADLLYGCGVTPPTARPTATRTITSSPTSSPVPTSTPTAVVTPPLIAGEWREDQYELTSSSCVGGINAAIENLLSELPPCVYTVTQAGSSVTITDCDGVGATGELEQGSVVVVDLPVDDLTEDGCTIVFDPEFRGDLGSSPTTVQQSLDVSFQGACEMAPCAIVVESRWTRV
jgi:hypothetical protein